MEVFVHFEGKNLHHPFFKGFKYQGTVVQSIISLMSLLMTNLLTVVAKVFSNTLYIDIFAAMQKLPTFIQQTVSVYLPYFKIEILTSR